MEKVPPDRKISPHKNLFGKVGFLCNEWNSCIVLLGNFLIQGDELPQANYIRYKNVSYCLVPSRKCKHSLNKNQQHMVLFRSQNSSSKSDNRTGEMKYVSKTYFCAGERVRKWGEVGRSKMVKRNIKERRKEGD